MLLQFGGFPNKSFSNIVGAANHHEEKCSADGTCPGDIGEAVVDQTNFDDPRIPELAKKSNEAMTTFTTSQDKIDLHRARDHMSAAVQLAPRNAMLRAILAKILTMLRRHGEALPHYRAILKGGVVITNKLENLAGYVLSLHQSGSAGAAELNEVWPRIVSMPEVPWRSPLQCPASVEETLLAGAQPFPEPERYEIPSLLLKHRDSLLADFERVSSHPKWDSFWKGHRDHDLVSDPKQWTAINLFQMPSGWNKRFCKLARTACKIMRGNLAIEGVVNDKSVGTVDLLRLDAGAVIHPHFGQENWRFVAHFALHSEDVVYLAGNETRSLRTGEVLVLDDTFLHSVENRGKVPRINLAVNFFNPLIKPITYKEWLAQ